MNAALNTAYDHYLSAYAPKSLTRYDAHKKSELRNVYNSIVQQNKDAPWYLPTTSKDAQNYAVDLKENARMLHNTIAQLGGLEQDGLLSKKSAFSTDEDIVKATYIGKDRPDEMIPEVELEVHSLASPQENMGLFLPNELVSLRPDSYSFDVSINDMNYEFQFSIDEDETNREIQTRLVRLINGSDIGIKASLIESEGRTALRMTSESSGLSGGRSRIFDISDNHTSRASGTVDYLGLDYVSREAADASISVNGEERTIHDNRFRVGDTFEVQLYGVTAKDESVRISLKTDVDSLTDNVARLIGGYNDFLRAAASYLETQSKSSTLVNEMKGLVSRYGNSMESMGVNMDKDGSLTVDKNLLRQTVTQSSNLGETFSYLNDLSSSLLQKSEQVSLNPMEYVKKTMVAYKNPGHNFVSPYTTSAYSGMMFNSYC